MFHGLTIKEYIIEHINEDTEFWSLEIGAYYILDCLLYFSDKDWAWISKEVLNWEQDEIEILAIVLASYDPLPSEADKILKQRFTLFSQIFESMEAGLAYNLLDDLEIFLGLDVSNLEIESLRNIQIQFDKIKEIFKEANYVPWFSKIQNILSERMKEAVIKS